MPSTIVTLVLFVIALSLVAVNFYIHWQAGGAGNGADKKK
jgi:hypothetical protein